MLLCAITARAAPLLCGISWREYARLSQLRPPATKYSRLAGLNNRIWRPEVQDQVSVGLVASEAYLLGLQTPPSHFVLMRSFLCAHTSGIFLRIHISSFCEDTRQIGLGHTFTVSF